MNKLHNNNNNKQQPISPAVCTKVLSLVSLSKLKKYQVQSLSGYVSISEDCFQLRVLVHIREDFSKFILEIVTIPRKIPRLTRCLYYSRYSNSDMRLVGQPGNQQRRTVRQEWVQHWLGGFNVVHVAFKIKIWRKKIKIKRHKALEMCAALKLNHTWMCSGSTSQWKKLGILWHFVEGCGQRSDHLAFKANRMVKFILTSSH